MRRSSDHSQVGRFSSPSSASLAYLSPKPLIRKGSRQWLRTAGIVFGVTMGLWGCGIEKLLTDPTVSDANPEQAPAVRLEFTSNPANMTAGDPTGPAIHISALTQSGQVAKSFVGEVTVSLIGARAGTSLHGTVERQAVGGVATFDDLSVDRAGTGYRLEARSSNLTIATSAPFNVTAAEPARLVSSSGDGQVDTVEATLTLPYLVTMTDEFGNAIPNARVEWTVTSGGGQIDPTTGVTDATGTARAMHTLGTQPGDQTVTATTSSIPAGSVTFTSTAEHASLARLRFVQQPSTVRADREIRPAVVVAGEDRFGNPTTGFTGSVTISLVPGSGNRFGELSGTLTRNASGGAATFSDLQIDEEGKGYRLRATAGSVTNDSQPFTVRDH